jgi:hypothetical protein
MKNNINPFELSEEEKVERDKEEGNFKFLDERLFCVHSDLNTLGDGIESVYRRLKKIENHLVKDQSAQALVILREIMRRF